MPGVTFEGVGELKNYRFFFTSYKTSTIIADNNHSVWGVVWCLSTRDIHSLEKEENRNLGRYNRVFKRVILENLDTLGVFLHVSKSVDKPSINQIVLDDIIAQATYWALPSRYIGYLKSLPSLIPLYPRIR